MSSPNSLITDFLKTEFLHIDSLDLVLSIPKDQNYAEIFFQKFQRHFIDRSLIEKNFTRDKTTFSIKCFPLFKEIHTIALQTIDSLEKSPNINPQKSIQTLYQCLLSESDLFQHSNYSTSYEKVPVIPKILDYLCSSDHIGKLYLETSLFLNKNDSSDNLMTFSKVFCHALGLIKMFKAYNYDLYQMYKECFSNKEAFVSSFTACFVQETTPYGNKLLEHLKELGSSPFIPPLQLQKFIQNNELNIIKGSNDYYILLGNMILAYQILHEDIENILTNLIIAQSLYSIFISLDSLDLHHLPFYIFQDLKLIPNPTICECLDLLSTKSQDSTNSKKTHDYLKSIERIVTSLALSINTIKDLPAIKKDRGDLNNLLTSLIIPSSDKQESFLLKIFHEIDDLDQSQRHRSFEDLEEMKGFIGQEREKSSQFCIENIVDHIIDLLLKIKTEIRQGESHYLYDIDSITAEFTCIESNISYLFYKRLSSYNWTDGYLNLDEMTRYTIWIEKLYTSEKGDKTEAHDYLVQMFTKFEDLVALSLTDDFLEAIERSSDPEFLIKKHYYVLNLLRRCTLLTLTNEDIGAINETDTILSKILLSKMLETLQEICLEEDEESNHHENSRILEQIRENCAYMYLYLHGVATLTFIDAVNSSRIQIDQDYTVKILCDLAIKFIEDNYKFYEVGCIVFEIIHNSKILDKAFELIPEHLERLLFEVLPDINLYSSRVNEMFPLNEVSKLVLSVLDLRIYTASPAQITICRHYIVRFLTILRDSLDALQEELFVYDFQEQSEADNEYFIYKIKSKVVYFCKVFQGISLHARAFMLIFMQTQEEEELTEMGNLLNSILMNPLLFLVESSFRDRFFSVFRTVYNTDSSFQIQTINQIFDTFNTLSHGLKVYLENHAHHEGLDLIKNTINYFGAFRIQLKQNLISSFLTVNNSSAVKSLLQLELIHCFFSEVLENCIVSRESLFTLAGTFEDVINLSLDLELNCKKELLLPNPAHENVPSPELFANQNVNIYTKILVRNIFTAVCCINIPQVNGPIAKKLEEFASQNLNFDSLPPLQELKNDPTPLTKQIYAFDLLLRLFPEEFSISSHRLFLSSGKSIKIIVTWVSRVLSEYRTLTECYDYMALNDLEAIISLWMERIAVVIQPLYETDNEKLHELQDSLEHIGEVESDYYNSLCQLIETDLCFFENLHPECRTLPVIFVNYYLLIKTLLQYKKFHEKGQDKSLSLTCSNLKNKEFFEQTYHKAKSSLIKGFKSFYIFHLMICYQDILELLSKEEASFLIEENCKEIILTGARLTSRLDLIEELGLQDYNPDLVKEKLKLDFPYYEEKWQRILNYIEYSMRYFRKAAELGSLFKLPIDKYLNFLFKLALDFVKTLPSPDLKAIPTQYQRIALKYRYKLFNLRVHWEAMNRLSTDIILQKRSPSDQLSQEKTAEVLDIFSTLIAQINIHEYFKESNLAEKHFLKTTFGFEPYMILILLEWLQTQPPCLTKLIENPKALKTLISNASSDLTLELLIYIFKIYGINAFPVRDTVQILAKGLVFSDPTGELLKDSERIEGYSQLIGKDLTDIIMSTFSMNNNSISLLDPSNNSFGTIKVNDQTQIPTLEYLKTGINKITQQAVDILIESYLDHFNKTILAIYKQEQPENKMFQAFYILAFLLMKFPELSPYVLSYKITPSNYEFINNYPDLHDLPLQITLLEFLARFETYYFPGFIHIQQAVCYNSKQPIAIEISQDQTTTLHGYYIEKFLEENLKILKEMIDSQGKLKESTNNMWKWRVYTRNASQTFFSCSSYHKTDFPYAAFRAYILFIFKSIAICSCKKTAFSYELLPCLMQFIHQLLDLALIKGIDVRLQKIKQSFQSKAWQRIKGGKKFLELAKFYGRQSRDRLISRHIDIPQSQNNFTFISELETEEALGSSKKQVIEQPTELLLTGNEARKCHWVGNIPDDELFKKTNQTILMEYLDEIKKINRELGGFVQRFVQNTDEKGKLKKLFDDLAKISEKNQSFSESFYEIIQFNWKHRFGTEENWRKKLPQKALDAFPRSQIDYLQDPSRDYENLKNLLASQLNKTQEEILKSKKKSATKSITKRELQDVIRKIKRKGHIIKKKLHQVLEDKLLESMDDEDTTIQTEDFSQRFLTRLEAYLLSLPESERNVYYYFLDDDMISKFSPPISEKGKSIKRKIERELDNYEDFNENNTLMEINILNQDIIIEEDEDGVDAKPTEEIFNSMLNTTAEDETKATFAQESRSLAHMDYASDEEENITNGPNAQQLISQSTNLRDRDDYVSDNEEGERNGFTKPQSAEAENQEELENLQPAGANVPMSENESDSGSEMGQDEDNDLNYDDISFCTNSDDSDIDYERCVEIKGIEENLWMKLYDEDIADTKILDDLCQVLVVIPDENIPDILAFFSNNLNYELHTDKKNTYIHFHYRKLEALMIDPINEAKFLHCFTVVINYFHLTTLAPRENSAGSQEIHSCFLINLMQFLHYYIRANPDGIFKYTPDQLKQYNPCLKSLFTDEIWNQISKFTSFSLLSRLFTLFNLQVFEKNDLFAEKLMNLICHIFKISNQKKRKVTLNNFELEQLYRVFGSRRCMESPLFRQRLGKTLRNLGNLPSHVQIFQTVEKRVFQERISVLLDILNKKYETIQSLCHHDVNDSFTSMHSEDFRTITRTLACPELEHFLEILRCFDGHINASSDQVGIIEFAQHLIEYGEVRKIVTTCSQTLMLLKTLYDEKNDFSSCINSVATYIWCLLYIHNLIREARLHEGLKIRSLKSLTRQTSIEPIEEVEFGDFEDLNPEALFEKLDGVLFYVRDLINLVFGLRVKTLCKIPRLFEILSSTSMRRLLNLTTKEDIVRVYFYQNSNLLSQEIIPVEVKRSHILEDSLKVLQKNLPKLKMPATRLKISFHREEGIDQGGLKKEWFSLLINNLFDPKTGLFKLSHNLRCLYPNPQSIIIPNSLSLFRAAGNIIGLSIKENISTGVSFTRSFLKFLLGRDSTLNDLEEIDPALAKSLQFMVHNSVTDVLELPFTYEVEFFGTKRVVELVENGQDLLLSDQNKQRYITAFLRAKLCKEIEAQTQEFKTGLFEIVPEYLLKYLLPYELETLICGQTEIEVDFLKENVQYKNCSSSTPLIKWFWDAIRDFDQEERMSLLFFITGASSIPYSGFKDFQITITRSNKSEDSLPIAHTCFSELELPDYKDQETLREKIMMAINEGKEGFYIV